jgi:hypothetical protein
LAYFLAGPGVPAGLVFWFGKAGVAIALAAFVAFVIALPSQKVAVHNVG